MALTAVHVIMDLLAMASTVLTLTNAQQARILVMRMQSAKIQSDLLSVLVTLVSMVMASLVQM